MSIELIGALVYLVIGGLLALVVFLVDRGDGREYARTLGRWWTPLLYAGLVLLWPPALVVLGVGVLTGAIS
jgi:hypothetical protein